MKEKLKTILLISIIIIAVIVSVIFIFTLIDYISSKNDLNNALSKSSNNENYNYEMVEGNNEVIKVDNDSSIRIIAEYNENMFKGHKSLIFFWASWCSHCKEEYDVVKTAIDNYQNRGYTIYVISHDYEISELAEFMKNNEFNYEVYFDEERIIRKNIDPEASSVPLTYILNEDGKLVDFYDGPISIEELDRLMNKNV